ncbi:hypothetical protein G6F35_014394 [Rhizopus arrhizus]|nr:hypothetical protein G6F35_014394 [Rhizopus arrhizus]
MDSLGNTSRQADRAAREIADLAQQSRQALARLNAPDGPLSVATRSLNDIALAAARLDGETLPAVTNMAANVSAAARGATVTLRRVDSTPQSFFPNEDASRRFDPDPDRDPGGLRHWPRGRAALRIRPGPGHQARADAAGARAHRAEPAGCAGAVGYQRHLAGG